MSDGRRQSPRLSALVTQRSLKRDGPTKATTIAGVASFGSFAESATDDHPTVLFGSYEGAPGT